MKERERRARLLRLQALLRAAGTAFDVQRDLAGRFASDLSQRAGGVGHHEGLEAMFTRLFSDFTPKEAETFAVIRAYTEHALHPINRALAVWLREDTDYRTAHGPGQREIRLAELLNQLDAHVWLWLAKYEGWIPGRPDHALVYLADEEDHGLGFPHEVDAAVDDVVGAR